MKSCSAIASHIPQVYRRSERLKHKKRIAALFQRGKILNLYPLRVLYLPCADLTTHQVLFAVPSKKVKRAVARNKLKRRMREAYRLHKHLLLAGRGTHFLLGYVYVGPSEASPFAILQKKMITSFQYLNSLHTGLGHDS